MQIVNNVRKKKKPVDIDRKIIITEFDLSDSLNNEKSECIERKRKCIRTGELKTEIKKPKLKNKADLQKSRTLKSHQILLLKICHQL